MGSSKTKEFNNTYAGSLIGTFGNSGPFVKQVLANGYETLTGESAKWYETYDVHITWDEQHRGSPYKSYLWIDGNGTFMESPILYKNDKASFVKGTNIMGFCFDYTTVADLPINNSTPVSADYQKLFLDFTK